MPHPVGSEKIRSVWVLVSRSGVVWCEVMLVCCDVTGVRVLRRGVGMPRCECYVLVRCNVVLCDDVFEFAHLCHRGDAVGAGVGVAVVVVTLLLESIGALGSFVV